MWQQNTSTRRLTESMPAAGSALDEQAIRLAVVASMRHQDTDYDALLMLGVPRTDAREQVQPDIDRVLAAWRDA